MKNEEKNQKLAAAVSLANLVDKAGAPRWFVVMSEPRREKFALARIREAGFVSYLPMRPVAKKTATYATPLFPGYLFVQMDLANGEWWRIFTTLDVAAVITRQSRAGRPIPLPLPSGVITKIMTKEVGGLVQLAKPQAKDKRNGDGAPFKPGDKLKITGGPLVGFDGLFMHGDANRVAVLVSLFGCETKVELTAKEIEAVREAANTSVAPATKTAA